MSWDEEGVFAAWRGREVRVTLVPFRPDHAPRILEWAQTEAELASWASLSERPGPEIFAGWLAAEDVEGYVLTGDDGEPVAYGELWISIEEDEVELGRLLVAPAHRRRGVGRHLVSRLLEIARRHDVSSAWVRVVESNGPALACYRSAGFQPVSAEEERALNAAQPRAYRWLRLALRGAGGERQPGGR